MAELMPQERLQPALLDRLTDTAPDKKRESLDARIINKTGLRQAVMRDLAWLFNTTRHVNPTDWEAFPHAAHSVVNFGLPPLAGETASTLDIVGLELSIRNAILDFEPRIMPQTLKVEAVVSDQRMDRHNVIGVNIRGMLWAQPVPLELLLRTELNLETGEVEVRDLFGGG